MGLSLERYLRLLKEAGLDSLPGTAAEVLDEDVRAILCPDKVTSDRWLEIMECAHEVGLFSTATIMFGHVDSAPAWITHWQRVIELQRSTGGFSEVVPLPFVSEGAPLYRRGESRPGPTWREARLMHAVLRLTVGHVIPNIQASWVKLGRSGALEMLSVGANDLGGVLINESITRAAGAAHGQMWQPEALSQAIVGAGRIPQQRNTRYEPLQTSAIDLQPTLIRWVGETPAGQVATSKTT